MEAAHAKQTHSQECPDCERRREGFLLICNVHSKAAMHVVQGRIGMSNLLLNWRFGTRHLQIHKGRPWITFTVNSWWLDNKPEKWFEVM